ncbi:exosortase/archaeosortase family protein [Marinimicrobium alkaliphilum]|uniref:exosortase/archaeosortase family protein n=1 Tax=Marinimicrobium alkaliphilum TaxID=2202654 RepID=UPI001E3CB769|nr:exosortase/archaeosortase family protein [Marinimicrobium alkaliphilum]
MIALGWVVLFFTTFQDLWGRWTRWDSEMAHGIPTFLVFFYLLWRSLPWNAPSQPLRIVEYGLTLGVIVLLVFVWAVAYAVNIQIIEQLLLVPILLSVFAAIYGWKVVFVHRFVLLFPVFAIPIWGSFNNILLEMASLVVGEMVRWIEIPAVIRGNSIHIPFGQILIADGCSGIRYFVIALTLAYLIGCLNNYREGRMAALLMIGALLGLMTNWVRIFVLILIGYRTEMQSSLMQDHELFGWILFAAICIPAIYFAPVVKAKAMAHDMPDRAVLPARRGIMLGLCVLVGPLLALYFSAQASSSFGNRAGDEASSMNVQGPSMPMTVRAPPGAVTSVERSEGVFVRKDHYRRQSMDDKLVPYIPRLFDHQFWHRGETFSFEHEGFSYTLSEFSAVSERRAVVQVQWFRIGDIKTNSVPHAKVLQVPAVFRGINDFYIFTLQAECTRGGCESARERIEAALSSGASELFPTL